MTLNRNILSIAVPSIIANITTPLLGLIDIVITGHLGSAVYIAAISVGGTVFNMIYWLFGFLRMGTSGLTAQAYGGGDRRKSLRVLGEAMLIALTIGAVTVMLQWPIIEVGLNLIDVSGQERQCAATYIGILIWGAPAVLATYALNGWFLGMQNARIPMTVSIVTNILNISISLGLVMGLGMKIEGVALGTLSAQYSGMVLGVVLLCKKFPATDWKQMTGFRLHEVKAFFKVNRDIFLRTLCLITVTVWFTRIGASQGTDILAVNAVLMQFMMLFSYFTDGFAYAGEALTGKLIGQTDFTVLRGMIKRLFLWSLCLSLIFSLVYFTLGGFILSIVSDSPAIVVKAKEYMGWVILLPIAGFAAFTWDGIFIGATRTGFMLLSMGVATAMFATSYVLLFPRFGNHGLWAAFLVYLLSRGVVLTLSQKWLFKPQNRHTLVE